MIGLCFVVAVLASPFKSKIRLEAENATLRHQLVVLRRKLKGRARLTNNDRWFFVQLYRWFPSILPALMIIRPDTLVRWHRAGFRRYWRWKSRSRGGRPQIDLELRTLIRFVLAVLASPFKSNSRLEAENAVLRHQLIVLQRRVRGRALATANDRWFLVQMYRWFPSILTVVTIVRPEMPVRWHRAGFRRHWRWKSRSRGGRPQNYVR